MESGDRIAEVTSPYEWIGNTAWLPDNRHVSFRGSDGLGVVDIRTGEMVLRTRDTTNYVATAQSETSLALGWWNHVACHDSQLTLQSTLVLPTASSTGALLVQPEGACRLGPNAPPPRFVTFSEGVQETLERPHEAMSR